MATVSRATVRLAVHGSTGSLALANGLESNRYAYKHTQCHLCMSM